MKVLLLTMAVLFSAHVKAEDWDAAGSYKSKCSEGTMLEMNRCLRAELDKLDVRLNESYRALLAELADSTELRKAQRAWVAFRETTCDFSVSGLEPGGSLYPYALHACRISLTVKRLRDFEEYSTWNCNGCPPRK
jgi:uncharacterized protein YecT (DUF1311 family)